MDVARTATGRLRTKDGDKEETVPWMAKDVKDKRQRIGMGSEQMSTIWKQSQGCGPSSEPNQSCLISLLEHFGSQQFGQRTWVLINLRP